MTAEPVSKSILVTGASGFIGLHLVRRLLLDGHRVKTLCRTAGSALAIMASQDPRLQNRQGDLLTLEDKELDLLLADIDVVYHLAGLVSYQRRDITRQRLVNVEGTRRLCLAASRRPGLRFIHTSSIAGMGVPERDGELADESLVYNLSGLNLGYCDSKHESEQVVMRFASEGLDAVILSPGIIFGEGDTHVHHFRIFRSMSQGRALFVPRGGIPFSDINDVIAAHLNALGRGRRGERYCLVSANRTFKEAAQTFARLYMGKQTAASNLLEIPPAVTLIAGFICENILYDFGLKNSLTWQQAWLANKKIFFASDKAVRELGFAPTPFDEMIIRTTPYYLGKSAPLVSG
ncbi:MAG: SDR family oxidoreductase [Cyanobacteria bacterium REEB67]|nr:SDR family oxidoreductase [Cyanobacteria bacterium REEB67]